MKHASLHQYTGGGGGGGGGGDDDDDDGSDDEFFDCAEYVDEWRDRPASRRRFLSATRLV